MFTAVGVRKDKNVRRWCLIERLIALRFTYQDRGLVDSDGSTQATIESVGVSGNSRYTEYIF